MSKSCTLNRFFDQFLNYIFIYIALIDMRKLKSLFAVVVLASRVRVTYSVSLILLCLNNTLILFARVILNLLLNKYKYLKYLK